MLPHQERVVTEEAELAEKIQKLDTFLDGAMFKTLSENHQRLLNEQYRHMVRYRLVLEQRIRMFRENA